MKSPPLLDRHLLLLFGERLKQLRKARSLDTVEMATRAGISRKTLRAIESGDPTTAIGTYLRVMSILGLSGELALLAGGAFLPVPAGSAAARSQRGVPAVEVRVSFDRDRHRLQDFKSLILHEEAVRLAKIDPTLVDEAKGILSSWMISGDTRSVRLWREWAKILDSGAWRKILGRSQRAQQLRQTSPLVTVLPENVRQSIYAQLNNLKTDFTLSNKDEFNRPTQFEPQHRKT